MKKQKKLAIVGWTALILVAAATIVGAVIVIRMDTQLPSAPAIEEEAGTAELIDELKELIDEDEASNEEALAQGTSTATLESLREKGNEFGVAVRTFNAPINRFELEIIVQASDPQPGNSYSAILIGKDGELPLGELIKEVENTFSLSFDTINSIEAYDIIEIVEVGENETKVLRGEFE